MTSSDSVRTAALIVFVIGLFMILLPPVPPHTGVLLTITLVILVIGGAALWSFLATVIFPPIDNGQSQPNNSTASTPQPDDEITEYERLEQRYFDGELTEQEFEDRVEQLMESTPDAFEFEVPDATSNDSRNTDSSIERERNHG